MKRLLAVAVCAVVGLMAVDAQAATPSSQDKGKKQNVVVRDHRSAGTTVVDPAPVKPIVRDHRSGGTLSVDPAKDKPVIRDHRTVTSGEGMIVRDHRTGTFDPIVRDHRTPGTVKPITPVLPVWPVKDPPVKVDPPVKHPPKHTPIFPGGPIKPIDPPKGPGKPPKDPCQDDCQKPSFPWWQVFGGFGVPSFGVPSFGVPSFGGPSYCPPACAPDGAVCEPTVVEAPCATPTIVAALTRISPGMDVMIAAADLGAATGQAVVKIDEMVVPAEVLAWESESATLRLPMLMLSKPVVAELFLIRADGTIGSTIECQLLMADAK